jgi:hypothetical protein
MKKLPPLLFLAFMLACSNKAPSNGITSINDQDSRYGTCVVALPKIALAKMTTEKFIFDLTISGPNMEPMQRSWILSGADTQAIINKIPPGELRVFTGTLTGSIQGVTHVGADTVAIIAGKTAYVNLVLRKTGNAIVNVIIEDMNAPGMTGCYAFEGRIDTTTFTKTKLKILSDSSSPEMLGYLWQNGMMIGKVYGPQPSGSDPVVWTINVPTSGLFFMRTYGDKTGFKGIVYKSYDSASSVGYASGFETSCVEDTVMPPPATLSGCFTFQGNIDTTKFSNAVFQIFSSYPGSLEGVVTQNGRALAKVSGPQPSAGGAPVIWRVGLANSGDMFLLKVVTDGSGTSFKGLAYNSSDSNKVVGSMYGFKTSCDSDTVVPPPATMSGCYTFEGNIDTAKFVNTKLQIFSGSSNELYGTVLQNGQAIAKVRGSQPIPNSGTSVSWFVSFANGGYYILKANTNGDGSYYKTYVYKPSDTISEVGYIWGYKTSCDTVVPPPPTPIVLKGCFTFQGQIDTTRLQNLALRILSDTTSDTVFGAVTQNWDTLGYVSGPRPSANGAPVSWRLMSIFTYPLNPLTMKVAFDGSGTVYKSIVYNPSDTTKALGTVFGQRTTCDIAPQKTGVLNGLR